MEADHNMDHLNHLDAVAAADVAHIKEKEATYRGSWKRRGGVGAFMMLARKWDRLEGMVQRWHPNNPGPSDGLNDAPYDIFGHIHRDPHGTDGTTLAEVRDLRRYLLLVEAEMVSRGVITLSPPVPQGGDWNKTSWAKEGMLEPSSPHRLNEEPPPRPDLYDQLSVAWSLPRSEVKRRVMRSAYGDPARDADEAAALTVLGQKWGLRFQDDVVKELMKLVVHLEQGVTHPGDMAPPPPAMDRQRAVDGMEPADYIALGLQYIGYMVDRNHEAPDVWDHLPRLAVELNNKEHEETLPEYRDLYHWSGGKWLMHEVYRERWGKQ